MKEETKCPWCGVLVRPKSSINKKECGNVKERKCPKCDSVIAAYLKEPQIVLEEVRLFQG